MKTINVCIRCSIWRIGNKRLTVQEKEAIYLITSLDILNIEFKNEVCSECRKGIGDKIAETLLERAK